MIQRTALVLLFIVFIRRPAHGTAVAHTTHSTQQKIFYLLLIEFLQNNSSNNNHQSVECQLILKLVKN